MCQICGKPNYVLCNCFPPPVAAAPIGFCAVKYDLACVFYNLDLRAKNGLTNINVLNNTNVKYIIDQFDILTGRDQEIVASGSIAPVNPNPPSDQYVKVDQNDIENGYLAEKITAGNNVTFVILNPGGNENIELSAINNKVSVDANDPPDYLMYQISGETCAPLDIVTINIVQSNGRLVLVPQTNVANLLQAITTSPNFQNKFCAAVNACLPPPVTPPCNPPSNFSAYISNNTGVLNWTPSGSGQTVVQYKLTTQSAYATYATVSATTSTISIPGLQPDATYDFQIYTSCSDGLVSSTLNTTAIQLTCPTVTVSSTTTSITATFPGLGGDITSYLVLLLNGAGTTIVNSSLIGEPFSSPISATFNNLTSGTSYNIQVQPSNGTISNTKCSLSPVTTVSLPGCIGPSNLNLTQSNNSIIATWTPDSTASSQNLYYGLTSGITGNPPGNGWTAYGGDPLSAASNTETITGLTAGDIYSVGINSTCQNGNITPLVKSQISLPLIITGNIEVGAGASAGAHQSDVSLLFTFPEPTPVPLTLYFGFLLHNSLSNYAYYGAGYSFFALPAGYSANPSYNGPTYGPSCQAGNIPSDPFVVTIPQGSLTYTLTPIYQTIVNHCTPWTYGTNSPNVVQMTDIYVTANSPSGTQVEFTLTQSPNTGTTINIHNVNT